MKATCQRATLKKVFGAVSAAVPSRSPRPILQDILVVVGDDGRATMAGTNLEQGFVHDLEVEGAEPGRALLPTEKVRRALAAWSDPWVAIEAGARDVRLSGPSADYEFRTEDPALFPAPAGFEAEGYHVIEARDLKRLVARTAFAVSTDAPRSGIAGVLAQPGDGTMTFVGLDGNRGGRQVVPATREGDPHHPGVPVSIPTRALEFVDRNLSAEDAPVHAAFTDRRATFRTATAVISTPLVAGRFPDFRQALPPSHAHRIGMAAGALKSAVDQAAVVTDEVTNSVTLRFEAATLWVFGAAEAGRARARVPIRHDGAPHEVRMAPNFLAQALAALGESQAIWVELGGPDHVLTEAELKAGADPQSFVIRTDDGYTHTIMTRHIVL